MRLSPAGGPVVPEHFRDTRRLFRIVIGGFYFHPSDENLSLGTPVRKKPLESMDSVYTNSENVIVSGARRIARRRRNFQLLDACAAALNQDDQHDDKKHASGNPNNHGIVHIELLPCLFSTK